MGYGKRCHFQNSPIWEILWDTETVTDRPREIKPVYHKQKKNRSFVMSHPLLR